MGLAGRPAARYAEAGGTWAARQHLPQHDLLARALAHGLGGQVVGEGRVQLDVGTGLPFHIRTRTGAIAQFGPAGLARVSLYCWVSGGPLGASETLLATGGFGRDEFEAIESGALHWGQLLGPLLRATAGQSAPQVHREPACLDHPGYLLVCNRDDQGICLGEDVDSWAAIFAELRLELAPGQWLTPAVVASCMLPPLPTGQITLLSIAVIDAPAARTVGVSINGQDWPWAATALRRIPGPASHRRTVVLREAAALIPAL